MSNPLVQQGTLNRLIASVIWADFPELNITASFLGKEGIRLAFEGQSTVFIDTMTGAVTSPEPYLRVNLRAHLLKTQNLSNLYKAQQELSTLLGDGIVQPDVTQGSGVLGPYQITNCAIQSVDELNFSGEDAGYAVRVQGYYLLNAALWG